MIQSNHQTKVVRDESGGWVSQSTGILEEFCFGEPIFVFGASGIMIFWILTTEFLKFSTTTMSIIQEYVGARLWISRQGERPVKKE
jgi:hypothetical protein